RRLTSGPSLRKTWSFFDCGSSSVDRASPCQGEGRGFEPRLPLHLRFFEGRMFQARDVMTSNPASVSSQSNVEDVVEFFLQNSFSSAPVLDDSGRVLGQLSELNLMRAFVKVEVSQSQNQKL